MAMDRNPSRLKDTRAPMRPNVLGLKDLKSKPCASLHDWR